MDEYIKRETAIAMVEEKQKELCPVGRYGRGYVYGSDREKYDAWDEIIDALETISSADVAPVKHARNLAADVGATICSSCRVYLDETMRIVREDNGDDAVYYYQPKYCANCGAKFDGDGGNESEND